MAVVVSGVASLVLEVTDNVEMGSIITATTLLSLQITQDSDCVTIGSQGKVIVVGPSSVPSDLCQAGPGHPDCPC